MNTVSEKFDSEEFDSDLEDIRVVNSIASKEENIYAELLICDNPVKIQIDCGATVNVLPRSVAEKTVIQPMKTLRRCGIRLW